MRKLTLTLVFFLISTIALTQVILVNKASKLSWDYTDVTYVDHFNIYTSRTPVVVPDGNPVATVTYGIFTTGTWEWTIDSQPGHWYAVATAVGNDVDTTESGPSNEVEYIVIGSPNNLIIVK